MIVLIDYLNCTSLQKYKNNNIIDYSNNNPFQKCFVYIKNNTIIGYLLFQYIYDRLEIDNFFVAEQYRNKRIGSNLLKKLLSYSECNNIKNITLEVKKNNNVAVSLYKKYGFVEIAIRKNYYGNTDGILMEKELI